MPDFTACLGRYWPGTSPLHRMDPRAKLLLSLAVMVIAFVAQNFVSLAVCAIFVAGFFVTAQIPLRAAFRSIAPLIFIVVITALLNVFFVSQGTVLFHWWFITITDQGIHNAIFISFGNGCCWHFKE